MENNLTFKYIVYCTTNIENGKIYIGVHKTDTPDKFDGYLGCGAIIDKASSYNKGKYHFHAAILKYGTHSFKRATIKVFDTLEEALALEAELVTEDFIKQSNNYNMIPGGGIPPDNSKSINQFDLEGNLIKTWDSITEVLNYYETRADMARVVRSKRNFAGFYWSFDKEINVEEYSKTSKRGFIDQYDLEGNYITSYKSTNIASQKLDIDFKKLNMAVFRMSPCEGYYFIKSGIDVKEIFCKKFRNSVKKHPIYRYLSTGEYDSEFSSMLEAQKALGKKLGSNLKRAVINGHLCNGYKWSFFKADNYFEIEEPKKDITNPVILQYDKEGNFIKEWSDYKECKKEFPYCLDVCRGKCKSTKGYVFKYK